MMNPLNLIKYVPLSIMRKVALHTSQTAHAIPHLSINRSININLRLAYPKLSSDERDTLQKEIIRHQALSTVEALKSWAMPPEWSIHQIDAVYNENIFKDALQNPNGMLAIVPHIGTWEIMNAWLNQFGSPTILYKPVKGKLSNEFILQGRERLNATLVPTDAAGVKAVFRTLKSGGFSIILPDHVPRPSGGVIVPFFGIETLSSTLAAKLASKTKCSLVGLSCVRNQNNRFDIYCTKLDDPDLYATDMVVATTALNKAMEAMIRAFPTHYMWGYRRFKHVPIIQNPYKASESELQHFIDTYVLPNQTD